MTLRQAQDEVVRQAQDEGGGDATTLAIGERLRTFVAALGDREVEWGVDDCSAWPAQWVADLTGRELMLPRYDSRDGAHALIDGMGGLKAMWTTVLRPAGIEQRFGEEPQCGDVGIVTTKRHGEVGGIFAHGRTFCWRMERGVWLLGPKLWTIVAVWAVAPPSEQPVEVWR